MVRHVAFLTIITTLTACFATVAEAQQTPRPPAATASGPNDLAAIAQTNGGSSPIEKGAVAHVVRGLSMDSNLQMYKDADFSAPTYTALTACSGPSCPMLRANILRQSFTTGILLGENQSLSCPFDGDNSGLANMLSYTGTGAALTISNTGAGLFGCGLALGTGATAGVSISGDEIAHAAINDVILSGGGPTTTFFKLQDLNALSMSNVEVWRHTAGSTAVLLSRTNDIRINAFKTYGADYLGGHADATSAGLVLDSQAFGTDVTGWGGGDSGLHGLWVRNSLNPTLLPPQQMVIHDLYADCTSHGSAGLFDPSLGPAALEAILSDDWFAGAGQDCTGDGIVIARNAHGLDIEQGGSIVVLGGRIRANTGAGYYNASSSIGNILIGSLITANNLYAAGADSPTTWSGVYEGPNSTGYAIIGNLSANNQDISGGDQQYGFDIESSGAKYGVVIANVCGQNTVRCLKEGDVNNSKITYLGNASPFGVPDPPNRIFGWLGDCSDNAIDVCTYDLPSFGTTSGNLGGHTFNLRFNAVTKNFETEAEGSNGAAGWLFDSAVDANSGLYVLPSTGATVGQTLSASALGSYQIVSFLNQHWNFKDSLVYISNDADVTQALIFRAGLTADQDKAIRFQSRTGTNQWSVEDDGKGAFHIRDLTNQIDRFWSAPTGLSVVDSYGSSDVEINAFVGAGTGGLTVRNGTTTGLGQLSAAAITGSTVTADTDGAVFVAGTGAANTVYASFGGSRGAIGLNGATGHTEVFAASGHDIDLQVASSFGGLSGFVGKFDSSGNFGVGPSAKATSDYFYVSSNGALTAASATIGGAPLKGNLIGTSSNIGGVPLAPGACSSASVAITGATTGMAVVVSPSADPGAGNYWQGFVSSPGNVIVRVCATIAGTPAAETYNVRVLQ